MDVVALPALLRLLIAVRSVRAKAQPRLFRKRSQKTKADPTTLGATTVALLAEWAVAAGTSMVDLLMWTTHRFELFNVLMVICIAAQFSLTVLVPLALSKVYRFLGFFSLSGCAYFRDADWDEALGWRIPQNLPFSEFVLLR